MQPSTNYTGQSAKPNPKTSTGKQVVKTEDCHMYLANGFCRFGAKCKYSHPSLARDADSNASGTDQPIGLTTLPCGPTGQPVQESGLILAAWQEELPTDCPNCSFLLQGIADGFNIVDIDKISTPVETDIYPSATGVAADKVEKQIITELENGQ